MEKIVLFDIDTSLMAFELGELARAGYRLKIVEAGPEYPVGDVGDVFLAVVVPETAIEYENESRNYPIVKFTNLKEISDNFLAALLEMSGGWVNVQLDKFSKYEVTVEIVNTSRIVEIEENPFDVEELN